MTRLWRRAASLAAIAFAFALAACASHGATTPATSQISGAANPLQTSATAPLDTDRSIDADLSRAMTGRQCFNGSRAS
jgi:hypothetical protein